MSVLGFGIDAWNASVDWGDGSAVDHFSVSGGEINSGVNDFSPEIWGGVLSGPGHLDHTYTAEGTYTITVEISGTPGSGFDETQTLTVTVGSSLALTMLARENASAYSID